MIFSVLLGRQVKILKDFSAIFQMFSGQGGVALNIEVKVELSPDLIRTIT